MIEKFSDYEGAGFLSQEGEFEFEVMDYELKDSKSGTPMAVFNVKSDVGQSTIYHSLNAKARWSYNNLIKACLKLNTKEKIEAFSCDYETIGNDLVGKKFLGTVEEQTYQKQVKVPLDDGTFEDGVEEKISYKIVSYKEA
ncbi:MAG: hypothetical protein IKA99_02500 [Clostridia bacterium]|nr:hypothetical protein [Clostridia bacterium]